MPNRANLHLCLLGLLLAAGAGQAADRLWVGPMPFVEGRTLRADFAPVLSDPANWPTVLGRAQVYKSYLMILPDVPVPGKTAPELSDADLTKLATLCRERGLKVAFEVGGLRQTPGQRPDQHWGEQCAAGELRWLRRWAKAGGSLDYLTTDHALMMNLGSHYVQPANYADCGMTMTEAMEQLAQYFLAARREFPQVRLGCIESLGFFHVTGPDGREYVRTVPALPVWRFEDYFIALVATLARHDLKLDHFHIDFGYEGARHDGGGQGKLDFGRIHGVQECVQAHGVNAGVIVNAFHDPVETPLDAAAASQQAIDHTVQFLDGYLAAGGGANQLILQTWMPYPDRTGPETDALTVLGLDRRLLEHLPPP